MAKCSAKLPEELLKKLSRIGSNMDAIADSALKAGGEVVLKNTKSNLENMVKGPSTGQLVNALGLSPVLLDRNGNYNIKVGFDEYRADGSANAMVANIIEYGKHGQPARPFLKNAKTKSKKNVKLLWHKK